MTEVLSNNFDYPATDEGKAASKAAHRNDHRVLHRDHDLIIRASPPLATATLNTAMLNDTIRRAIVGAGGAGGIVEVPPGIYPIDDSLRFHQANKLRFIGTGGQTYFHYVGANPTKPMMRVSHCFECKFSDFGLIAAMPCTAGIQLLRDNAPGVTLPPSRNVFEDVFIECSNLATDGVIFGGIDAIPGNNDFNIFNRCNINRYLNAGFRMNLNASQSYGNEMNACTLEAGEYGLFGVQANENLPGSFIWRGGFMHGNHTADFYLGSSVHPYTIDGYISEDAAAMLHMFSSVYCNASVSNSRWSAGHMDPNNTPIVVNSNNRGKHLTLFNNRIGDSSGDRPLRLWFLGDNQISMRMNTIYSSAPDVFTYDPPGDMFGNEKVLESALDTSPVALTSAG